MTRIAMVFLLFTVSTASSQENVGQTRGKATRKVAAGAWQIVRTIGLDAELFDQPRRMLATSDRIIVADGATNTITSMRIDGTLQWKSGRTGSGPGEYRDIVDMSIDSAGNVLVYDEGLHRMTVLDGAGKLRRVIQLPDRTDRVAFTAPTAYLLLNTAADTLARVIDTSGTISRALVRMPPDLKLAAGLAREMSSVLTVGNAYLITFRWSSRMQLIDRRGQLGRQCATVDSLSFAPIIETKLKNVAGMTNVRARRIDPRARQAAVGATVFSSRIAVVSGILNQKQRVLDLYALPCGPYVESRPFPFAFEALAGNDKLLFAMLSEPTPHIAVLRWIPR
jgi:hypothetical protein